LHQTLLFRMENKTSSRLLAAVASAAVGVAVFRFHRRRSNRPSVGCGASDSGGVVSHMREGDGVVVVSEFDAMGELPVRLKLGDRGIVDEIDADGDACIDFAHLDVLQWVRGEDFEHLRVLPADQTPSSSRRKPQRGRTPTSSGSHDTQHSALYSAQEREEAARSTFWAIEKMKREFVPELYGPGASCLGLVSTCKGQKCYLRLAKSTDCDDLLALVKQLAIDEGADGGADVVKITADQLRCDGGFHGDQASFQCILSIVDGRAVGFALFFWGYSTWSGKTLMLDDLFVMQEFRGKGLGLLLLQRVAQYGQSKGAQRIQWQSLKDNKPANSFYELRVGAENRERNTWLLEGPSLKKFMSSFSQ